MHFDYITLHTAQSAVYMVAARGTAPPVPLAATMCTAVHMVAARLGCKRRMVGTGWANSQPGSTNRLRKLYCHLVGGHLWQGRLLGN